MINSSRFNSTHYVVLYPQNGDCIVTTDSVTSLHPMYSTYMCDTRVRTQCRVGGAFCTLAHYFKMYAVYLSNVESARRLLSQLRRRSRDLDDVIRRLEVTDRTPRA